MTDLPPTPAGTLSRRCRCGRPVLMCETYGFRLTLALDPEPSPAGLYRLTPNGLAESVGPDDLAPGELLFSPHRCARPAVA